MEREIGWYWAKTDESFPGQWIPVLFLGGQRTWFFGNVEESWLARVVEWGDRIFPPEEEIW